MRMNPIIPLLASTAALAALFSFAPTRTGAATMEVTLAWDPRPTNEMVIAYNVYVAPVASTNWTKYGTTLQPPYTVRMTNATVQVAFTAVSNWGESVKTDPVLVPFVVANGKWSQIIVTP